MQETGHKPLEAFRSVFKNSQGSITVKQTGKDGNPGKTEKSSEKKLPERRRSRRRDVDHDVAFWNKGMESRSAHLVNICRDGLFLETTDQFEIGTVMNIKLPAMGARQFPCITTGKVVRRDAIGVAIQWR